MAHWICLSVNSINTRRQPPSIIFKLFEGVFVYPSNKVIRITGKPINYFGHAQAAGDTLLMDRNFCARAFLHGISAQQAYFTCRQHQGLPWEAAGEERFIGRGESGAIYEQRVWVSESDGNGRQYRRIRIVLKRPHVMATRSCMF